MPPLYTPGLYPDPLPPFMPWLVICRTRQHRCQIHQLFCQIFRILPLCLLLPMLEFSSLPLLTLAHSDPLPPFLPLLAPC